MWYNSCDFPGRRCHHAAIGRRNTAPDPGSGGGTEAPVGPRRPAAAAHRGRDLRQHDLLWPLRHRQDHHRLHHRQAHGEGPVSPERHHRVFAGCEGHHRGRGHHAGPQRGAAVPGRDPVFQQEAAAKPAGVHGKRQDHPHRLHHGESLFLCVQRPAVPQHGV